MAQRLHLESLIGSSQPFQRVLEKIPFFAESNATVLITGDTGTGKELFARAIHYHSPRRAKPFIPVNCGALPDHLFENELFGHAKGAFTDASSAEEGLLAEAQGGTLLLDEIDALSLYAQVKLLRFLQNREYRPLGSARSRIVDVRIIAATNTDLRTRVATGAFRDDMYHRLNVLRLVLPSLAERSEDIPLLADDFVARYAREHGRPPMRLGPGALRKLLAYRWPGNVRELEAVVQRAVVLASSPVLEAADIDLPDLVGAEPPPATFREAKTHVIVAFERTFLANLLAQHHGNISQAARAAGKERRAFQRLMRKHGLASCAFRR